MGFHIIQLGGLMKTNKVLLLIVLFCFCFGFSAISDAQWQELKKSYTVSQTNTSDPRVRFDLAMNYAYTGFLQEGFAELSALNKADSQYNKKILEDTSKELAIATGNWKTNFYYAFALYFNDRKDEAKDYFYKVVELSPEKSVKGWALGYIAYIYGEKKDWRTALKIIEDAIRYEPDGVGLYLAKGYGQQQVGDYFGLTGTLIKVGSLQASSVFNRYNIDNLKNEK